MTVFCVEIEARGASHDPNAARLTDALPGATSGVTAVEVSRLFFLEGELDRAAAEHIAADLLCDAVAERFNVRGADEPFAVPAGAVSVEVHLKPGVMDPVAESTLVELKEARSAVAAVRSAHRYVVRGDAAPEAVEKAVRQVVANDCIERVVVGTDGVRSAPQPPRIGFELRHVALRDLDDAGLERLSRDGHLFLSLPEMQAIRDYYRRAERDPTDLELETLAQTWSEHCVHKTLKSAIRYRGAPFADAGGEPIERRYENLLRDTIARVTRELSDSQRGPECLSVFEDNAGVIGFDEKYGIAFKVETHNHPSAIEPYGGAATGIGGCIRDVMGCGLAARPIANTDVFCVAPPSWPTDPLPKGVLHPERVLRGIGAGVADYGNRMGIPTVNGAICFDPRYLGNPLVYCGCVGLIPRDKVYKAAQSGDKIVVVGGRTGRDGIHGATFSSAELTDGHADEFSHAVQIGNPIMEKRCLDAILLARDAEGGCLYTAITDCGAGGLSSAVGEMGENVGAAVELSSVPLKYPGLRYDEIWISEAQERMVLAVPPEDLDKLLAIMRAEEVEATVIGDFGAVNAQNEARLEVRFEGTVVGELDMEFLHRGIPLTERDAEWTPPAVPRTPAAESLSESALLDRLHAQLAGDNVGSNEWLIRQYDHEVQGGSVVKPLGGPGAGPNDAAVLRPRLDSRRGIAVGCGFAPHLSDVDPYWMALASIDEALRNVVCVGGDPENTAILDNFCWGRSDDAQQLGALVRACQGCYDAALAFGVPFVSGKDSLNNEFALHTPDVEPLLQTLAAHLRAQPRQFPSPDAVIESVSQRVRATGRLAIPQSLLISAISVVEDVSRCVTADLKRPGDALLLLGGLPAIGFDLAAARRVHLLIAEAQRKRWLSACHDVSDGGWLTAVAEMAIAGGRGAKLRSPDAGTSAWKSPFAECVAGYVVSTGEMAAVEELAKSRGVDVTVLGSVREQPEVSIGSASMAVGDLRSAWREAGLRFSG